jgi:diguanylate cyclase (GGDEF)-like protein
MVPGKKVLGPFLRLLMDAEHGTSPSVLAISHAGIQRGGIMSSSNGTARQEVSEKVPSRSQEIQEHMGALAGRDLQLLSISLLMLLVLSGGILALVYPNFVSASKPFRADLRILPQLFFGLITLIVLFNVYVILQKRDLSATRRRLVEELIFNERMEAVSLIDPTTQLYNRRAMEQMVAHEVARANRLDAPLSVLVLDTSDLEAISNRLGTAEAEQFLYDAAQLVKNTLRGSDMVFRYKETQFLAVMPDTTEHQVDFAIKRLEGEIERHNAECRGNAELAFSYGVAQYAQGFRITDTLLNAERKAFLRKHDFAPIF